MNESPTTPEGSNSPAPEPVAPPAQPTMPMGGVATPSNQQPAQVPVAATESKGPSKLVKMIIIGLVVMFVFLVLGGIFVSMWSNTRDSLKQKANEATTTPSVRE